jgi:hypothetical protein
MKSLEQDLLKELLNYDPETGIFTWAVDRQRYKAGTIAGSINSCGYVHIGINGKTYKAHRLAWVYVYGSISKELQIDHINRNRVDNRISNLRLATSVEQGQNITHSIRNTSGYPGISWQKSHNKWRARIMLNRKSISIGYFDTPEAANDARIKAKAELHTFNPIQRTS